MLISSHSSQSNSGRFLSLALELAKQVLKTFCWPIVHVLTMSPGCFSQFKSLWAKVSRKRASLTPSTPPSDHTDTNFEATAVEKATSTSQPSSNTDAMADVVEKAATALEPRADQKTPLDVPNDGSGEPRHHQ